MDDLDVNPNDNDNELELGDLNDIFDSDPFSSAGGGTSPSGSPRGANTSQPGSPSQAAPGSDPAFRSVTTQSHSDDRETDCGHWTCEDRPVLTCHV